MCAFLASCSEAEKGDSIIEKELVPVSFNVGFSKEVVDFRSTTARNTEGAICSWLSYYVFDKETGELYKHKGLSVNNGIASDELPEGEYIFMFFMGDVGVSHGGNISNLSIKASYYGWHSEWSSEDNMTDVFSCRLDYEVKKGNENDSQIVLERMVGKVEVVLEDAIPDNVSQIVIATSHGLHDRKYNANSDHYYLSGSEWSDLSRLIFHISETDKSSSGFTMSFLGFENVDVDQEYTPFMIIVEAFRERTSDEVGLVNFDERNLLVVQKTISNVNIEKNKTVIYTGKLFDSLIPIDPNEKISSSFSVSVNDEWGDVINETFE